jgi:L-ascorbate metabolism protein UlaG (beta-lactamase superfamily)
VQITCLGHATFRFTTPERRVVLVDPWTTGNPLRSDRERRVERVDVVLVTHGHHDHVGDLVEISESRAPQVVAVAELGKWLAARGVRNVVTMNMGGIVDLQGVKVMMTPALHTSSLEEEPFA